MTNKDFSAYDGRMLEYAQSKSTVANISINQIKSILWSLLESENPCPHFEIDSDLKNLFFLTKFENNEIRLPFKLVKIDGDFFFEGVTFENIYIQEVIKGFNITYIHRIVGEKGYWLGNLELNKDFNYFSTEEERKNHDIEEYSEGEWSKKTTSKERGKVAQQYSKDLYKSENEMRKFIGNFINFINNPEKEEFIIDKTSDKEYIKKRLKRGLIPRPLVHKLKLSGKIKIYLDSIRNKKGKIDWENKFWVKGHWRELKSDKWKNMQGKIIWIHPFVKGKGELLERKYVLSEKQKYWQSQEQMILIIKSIYPNIEIQKNNRTTLDGLEIDCYIPSLKLGFEYNGLQHYEHIQVFHKTVEEFEAQKERDIEKRKRADKKGIKIITIKYDEEITEDLIKSKVNGKNYKLMEKSNDNKK